MEINLVKLTKSFKNVKGKEVSETIAVNNMDLTIASGELIGLLGPSGCGKSTTLYLISGLKAPTSGSIYFNDENITDLAPEKRGIGLVFQNYALYPHLTVYQNVQFPLDNLKVKENEKDLILESEAKRREILSSRGLLPLIQNEKRKEDYTLTSLLRAIAEKFDTSIYMAKEIVSIDPDGENGLERIKEAIKSSEEKSKLETDKLAMKGLTVNESYEILHNGSPREIERSLTKPEKDARIRAVSKLVQIENLLNRKPSELSGGQQQRVAIARALVKRPSVLLLDEPLSNLDARLRIQTREEIRRIQQETGITTIFVTHDQEEAMSICDQIVVMEKGFVRQVGHPQEVYRNPNCLFVAKFLGTPPINVFYGEIKEGGLFIGEEKIMNVPPTISYQKVMVGIRPEGFLMAEEAEGKEKVLTLECTNVLTQGRDLQLYCTSPYSEEGTIKLIVDSDIEAKTGTIKFALRKKKIYVFDSVSGERIEI